MTSGLCYHKKKCKGNHSENHFIDCGEILKQEIKEESDTKYVIYPLEFVNSELYEDFVESGELSVKSELYCIETIKLEMMRLKVIFPRLFDS